MAKLAASICLLLVSHVFASHGHSHVHQSLKRQSASPDLTKRYPVQNISIPLDHFHNESRYAPHTDQTFENSYWMDTSYYVPGGPVIVHAMGEDSPGDLVWLHSGLVQELANATGGIAVLWGQRYYAGDYYIVPNVTTENLRFHSTAQALADLAYFASHAKFTGFEDRNLTAPGTPWFIIGGSYAGVISAFTRIQYPDLFWGGIASSGVSTALLDDWPYYDVVRRYGQPACIEAQQKLIAIADTIMTSGNKTQIAQLKEAFGTVAASSNDALAVVLSSPMSGWQGRDWVPGQNYPFAGPGTFCANVTSQEILFPSTTNLTNIARDVIASAGWANETSTLLHPVLNWFGSISSYYLGFCQNETIDECYSFNTPSAFGYLACIENGGFGGGYIPGSPGRPSALPVASRLLTVEMGLEQCRTTFNLTSGPDLNSYNKYGGFNLSYPRLALSTGQLDIYRPFTPLAEETSFGVPNPRLKTNGTASQPQIVIQSGGHEWDLPGVFPNQTTATVPPEVVKVAHQREIQAVKTWLQEWRNEHGSS